MNSRNNWHRVGLSLLLIWMTSIITAQTLPLTSAPSDVAKDWQQTLEHGDLDALLATYDLVDTLTDAEGEFEHERCKANEEALTKALDTNPIGLAIWRAGYRCAELLGDTDALDYRLQRFEALIQYGLSQADDNVGRPIPVLTEADVWAFVEVSGQELLYAYYDDTRNMRYFYLVIGLWDPKTERERMLSFDYLDSIIQLVRDDPTTEFPVARRTVVSAWKQSAGDNPDLPLSVAWALTKAKEKPTSTERIDALEAIARDGSMFAAVAMLIACERFPDLKCGDRSIDALLPYAEEKWAFPMVMLASAYARGVIVPKDLEAARSMLDIADARLGGTNGRQLYAGMVMLQANFGEGWDLVKGDLERAAYAGDDRAAAMVAFVEIAKNPTGRLPRKLRNRLLDAAEAGHPIGQSAIGLELLRRNKITEGYAWMEKAAENQVASAQEMLGTALFRGDQLPRDVDRAVKWLKLAGNAGEADAMHMVAFHYMSKGDSLDNLKHVQGWLQSAALQGHRRAMFDLALLFEREVEGLAGNSKNALMLYRALLGRTDIDKNPDAPEIRRRLAMLLTNGRAGTVDRGEAIKLLKADATAGRVESQFALASIYLGNEQEEDHKEGLIWLDKAIAGKSVDARNYDAYMHWFGYRVPIDRDKAVQKWNAMIDDGVPFAVNNLAWVLCTAPDDNVRNGRRGLEVLERIELDSAGSGVIDTFAACYAANGDFEQAKVMQQRAIQSARERGPSALFLKDLESRLKRYEDREIFIEAVPEFFQSQRAVHSVDQPAVDAVPEAPDAKATQQNSGTPDKQSAE